MAIIRILEPGEVPVALLSDVLPAPLSGTAVAGTSQFQLAKKQQLMLAIDSAATQEQLDAVVW